MRTADIALVAVLGLLVVVSLLQLSTQSAMQRALVAQTEALGTIAEEMKASRSAPETLAETAPSDHDEPGRGFMEAAVLLSGAPNATIRASVATILGQIGGDNAVACLVEMGRDDPSCRHAVFEALRHLQSPEATRVLTGLIRDGTRDERRQAADVLPHIITAEMVPAVGELLGQITFSNEDSNRHVRRTIYSALQRLGEPTACRPLLVALIRETDDGQRRAVLEAMSACTTRQSVLVLCEALNAIPVPSKGDDGYVYHALVRTIGKAEDPRATEYLMPLLRADDPKLVRTVVEALGEIRDPLAAGALCEMEPTDNEVRRVLDQYLKKGYPGVREENGRFVPLTADQMTPLLEHRAKFVESIEAVAEK